jgi:hypothetical protein
MLVSIGYIRSNKVPAKLLGGIEKTAHKLTIELDSYSVNSLLVSKKPFKHCTA